MHRYFLRKNDFKPSVERPPSPNLGLCVVIPSYDEPNLWQSLSSIISCQRPKCDVEVIVVANYPEGAGSQSLKFAAEAHKLVAKANTLVDEDRLRFHAIELEMPRKKAGVGYARMHGMDEAAWRLHLTGVDTGIIACFDADSTCQNNYLAELEMLWSRFPDTHACSIRFEHPLNGTDFDDAIYEGIAQYELHLRYYLQAARWVGHPFAFHTMGSSMACSCSAYMRFGGMNSRKAGEDFYFLQKIIPHGFFKELNTTCVFPSPRPSQRVPFGTGRAISQLESNAGLVLTYSSQVWSTIAPFFQSADSLYGADREAMGLLLQNQHPVLKNFLESKSFISRIEEINSNTSSRSTFIKRFFLWFDSFLLMKYLNFAHEEYFSKKPVVEEARNFLGMIGVSAGGGTSVGMLLEQYRSMQLDPWEPKEL